MQLRFYVKTNEFWTDVQHRNFLIKSILISSLNNFINISKLCKCVLTGTTRTTVFVYLSDKSQDEKPAALQDELSGDNDEGEEENEGELQIYKSILILILNK